MWNRGGRDRGGDPERVPEDALAQARAPQHDPEAGSVPHCCFFVLTNTHALTPHQQKKHDSKAIFARPALPFSLFAVQALRKPCCVDVSAVCFVKESVKRAWGAQFGEVVERPEEEDRRREVKGVLSLRVYEAEGLGSYPPRTGQRMEMRDEMRGG
eukprot:2044633-Rhodomonas_salina.1